LIFDRGRGPEIVGTRITIYRIMDFLKYKYSLSDIAKELDLTDVQVSAAVEYIQEHREESERQYRLIMERMKPQIVPEGERDRFKARGELRDRLRARLEGKGAHDHTVGQ